MTRKQAILIERRLRAMGVYKPYVSMDGATLCVESYPLTALVTHGAVDPEMGPVECVSLRDSSLARIGQDTKITSRRIFLGQDVIQHTGQLILDFHAPAYERASQQIGRASCRER